jgi:hypothetical protein
LAKVELEELSMKIRKNLTALVSTGLLSTGLLIAGVLCLPAAGRADTQTTHRVHKVKKQQPPPPPLPSGTRGPVPQVPLDSLPAVAPQVSYQDGLLTIVAPNSTLSEILRSVRKHTAAEIEIPSAASERVATHLGPGPAREVMAELLNGSRFNYILLGSPTDSNQLVRVVLVAKTPETPTPANGENAAAPGAAAPNADAPEAEAASEDTPDDNGDQAAADEQAPAEQPGVKTPQQMLQEMQQRQLLQQQQAGQNPQYPAPNGMPMPMRPPQVQTPPQEQ